MDTTSSSLQWRHRGNSQYELASQSTSTAGKLDHYATSMRYFKKALDEASGDGERSSALKNIAMTTCKQVETQKVAQRSASLRLLTPRMSQTNQISSASALKCFSSALECGRQTQGNLWCSKLRKEMKSCLDNELRDTDKLSTIKEKVTALYKLIEIISDKEYKVQCCMQLANLLISEGGKELKKGNYKTALDLFRESYNPIQQVKISEKFDVVDLEKDVKQKSRIAEARHAVEIGTTIMNKAISLEENQSEITEEIIFGAIDSFREAIMITDEKEFDIEAMSLSYIGRMYEILQQPQKAKEYYMRSIQLTGSMTNQSFILQGWYVDCTEALENMQGEKVEKEEMGNREIIKNHLQKEMKIIEDGKAKYEGDIPGLLRHISDKLPPTKLSFVLPSVDDMKTLSMKELKCITRELVLDYHSDKQKIKKKKLKVLNDEITKVLNGILERIKAAD